MDRGVPGKDLIGYQELTQAAMKGVLRAALKKIAAAGALPGEHHFYITFRTRTPGVVMADQLKDKFPDEMTIVIQHQYWDFEVHDDRFELILKFGGVPQHLSVPFSAVSRFFDPAVNFGLQFELDDDGLASVPPAEISLHGQTPPTTPEGTVVSLDAFRRK